MLLVFRHTEFPEAGIQVPGGTVEDGETIQSAALREAWEETGVEDLEMVAYLGMNILDLAEFDMVGLFQRHFFHLTPRSIPSESWRHWETNRSDGSSEPIEFEFYWVKYPEEVPELAGRQGAFLEKLVSGTH